MPSFTVTTVGARALLPLLKGSDLPRPFLCLGNRCLKQIKDCLNSFNAFVSVSGPPGWLQCLSSQHSPSFFLLLFVYLFTMYAEWLPVDDWPTDKDGYGPLPGLLSSMIWTVYIPSGCWNLTAAMSWYGNFT